MITLHVQEIEGLWCGVACEDKRVFATMFASSEKEAFKGLLRELPVNSIFQLAQGKDEFAEGVLRAIRDIVDGKDVSLNVEFAMPHLPPYTKRVLSLTSMIPKGYVTTYGALAETAGGSPRAIGRVMATNPFAPLIPCHRVVATDMTLCGYGGGLRLKWEILQKENKKHGKTIETKIGGRALRLLPISMVRQPRKQE